MTSGGKLTFASGTSLTVHSSKCTEAITINWQSKKLYLSHSQVYKSKFALCIFPQCDSDPEVEKCYQSTICSYSRTVKHFTEFLAALYALKDQDFKQDFKYKLFVT